MLRHPTQKLQNMAKCVCFGPSFNSIRWIQLCDKKSLALVDFWGKILLNLSWKKLIKLAKGPLSNIFQDWFNKILSQQLTHDRSYISQQSTNAIFFLSYNWIKLVILKNKGPKQTCWAIFWNVCVGWRHDLNIFVQCLDDVTKSYLKRVWDKKIQNGYITLETRVMW